MKSVKNEGVNDIKYPRLMVSRDGEVVLFTRERTGTVVFDLKFGNKLGYHSDDWWMHRFTDYYGEITLSND